MNSPPMTTSPPDTREAYKAACAYCETPAEPLPAILRDADERLHRDPPDVEGASICIHAARLMQAHAALSAPPAPSPSIEGDVREALVQARLKQLGYRTDESASAAEGAKNFVTAWLRFYEEPDVASALAAPPEGVVGELGEDDQEALDYLRRAKPTDMGHITFRMSPQLRDHIVKALSRHGAAAQGGEAWETVATAPTDNSPVLVLYANDDERPVEIRKADGEWWRAGMGPTHWMRIPARPAALQEHGNG